MMKNKLKKPKSCKLKYCCLKSGQQYKRNKGRFTCICKNMINKINDKLFSFDYCIYEFDFRNEEIKKIKDLLK